MAASIFSESNFLNLDTNLFCSLTNWFLIIKYITNTTIIDYIGNEADLTLTNSNFTNSLYSTGIEIDTTAPNGPTNWTITSTRSGSYNYFQYASEGDTVTVSLTFDESVTISSASFILNILNVKD